MKADYSFLEHEMQKAADEWGANCGPAALAFALQIPIDAVRGKIPGFEQKRYTSPTMMRQALANLGFSFKAIQDPNGEATVPVMLSPDEIQLVRVQWTGPWTAPGANPKWAYRQTHWIAAWLGGGLTEGVPMIFDCNGGITTFEAWRHSIVPILTGALHRADGGWFPTHVWRPQQHQVAEHAFTKHP